MAYESHLTALSREHAVTEVAAAVDRAQPEGIVVRRHLPVFRDVGFVFHGDSHINHLLKFGL